MQTTTLAGARLFVKAECQLQLLYLNAAIASRLAPTVWTESTNKEIARLSRWHRLRAKIKSPSP